MGMTNIPPQVAAQMAQRAGQQEPQAAQGGMSIPSQVAQAAQGGMGGKGGQPPSPQQLGRGLQLQAMMQRQMPLSNQRQPQGGLAGRTMTPQVQNAARMGSFRGY